MQCMPPPGACDEFTCALGCIACFQIGCCINGQCVCNGMMDCPMGSGGAGGMSGGGGAGGI
jgi:hypothetical protein